MNARRLFVNARRLFVNARRLFMNTRRLFVSTRRLFMNARVIIVGTRRIVVGTRVLMTNTTAIMTNARLIAEDARVIVIVSRRITRPFRRVLSISRNLGSDGPMERGRRRRMLAAIPVSLGVYLTHPRLRRILAWILRAKGVPESDLDDVIQRTLCEAWVKRGAFPAEERERDRLLCRLARCNAIDERRRARAARIDPDGDVDAAAARRTEGIGDSLGWAATHVATTPALQRALGWLVRHFSGDSYAEIAATDGVTENAIKCAVSDLRRAIRAARSAEDH